MREFVDISNKLNDYNMCLTMSNLYTLRFWFREMFIERLRWYKGWRSFLLKLIDHFLIVASNLGFVISQRLLVIKDKRFHLIKKAFGQTFLCIRGWRKNIFFVFDNKSRIPSAVLRISECSLSAERLCNAGLISADINKFFDKNMNFYVPKETYEAIDDDHSLLYRSFLPYPKLNSVCSSKEFNIASYGVLAEKVTNFLIELAKRTTNKELNSESLGIRFATCIEERVTFSDKIKVKDYVDALLSKVDKISAVTQHRDLQPENILYTEKQMVFYDWEYARRDGLPLVDLYYCLFSCFVWHKAKKINLSSFNVGHLDPRAVADRALYEEFFLESNDWSNILRKSVGKYSSALSLSQSDQELLFCYFNIFHLNDEQRFLNLIMGKNNELV